jgi:hypothetical protein
MKMKKCFPKHNPLSCIYFLGFIGAAVFYIGNAVSFGMGVVGFLQALVWPAFFVHAALEFFSM